MLIFAQIVTTQNLHFISGGIFYSHRFSAFAERQQMAKPA